MWEAEVKEQYTENAHRITEYKQNICPEYKQIKLLQPRYRIQAIARHIFNDNVAKVSDKELE